MKALVKKEPMKGIWMEEVAMPEVGVNDVLIKIKKTAIVLSTIIAGVGICFYSQSYGYLELYNAPKTIAFSAASALLIGGCTEHNGKISHVIAGTLIFHGIFVFSVPLANALIATELTEITRSILTNIIILFAMFKETGKEKHHEKAKR